jgi:hypothetical protein
MSDVGRCGALWPRTGVLAFLGTVSSSFLPLLPDLPQSFHCFFLVPSDFVLVDRDVDVGLLIVAGRRKVEPAQVPAQADNDRREQHERAKKTCHCQCLHAVLNKRPSQNGHRHTIDWDPAPHFWVRGGVRRRVGSGVSCALSTLITHADVRVNAFQNQLRFGLFVFPQAGQ